MTIFQNLSTFDTITLNCAYTATKAGDILRKGIGNLQKIETKNGFHNFVTEYDKASEKFIISELKREFPSSSFLCEECGQKGCNRSLIWIIDPLDGTMNFIHGIPIFSVSIAAVKDGELFAGAIYQPLINELFVAQKGKGAFLNGKQLFVSKEKSFKKAFLTTGFPYHIDKKLIHPTDIFSKIIKKGAAVRRLGSAAIDLAYVAAGRFDGYWEASLAPWDIAAGTLILTEAGGIVTDWENSPVSLNQKTAILATNGCIHNKLLSILKEAKKC